MSPNAKQCVENKEQKESLSNIFLQQCFPQSQLFHSWFKSPKFEYRSNFITIKLLGVAGGGGGAKTSVKSIFPSITSQIQSNTVNTKKERILEFQVRASLLLEKNSNAPLKYIMLGSVLTTQKLRSRDYPNCNFRNYWNCSFMEPRMHYSALKTYNVLQPVMCSTDQSSQAHYLVECSKVRKVPCSHSPGAQLPSPCSEGVNTVGTAGSAETWWASCSQ